MMNSQMTITATCKPTYLVCPVNLQPQMLRGRDAKLDDSLVYLAHAILMARVHAPRDERDGFMPLCHEYLIKIIGKRLWPRVKDLAFQRQLIACDRRYLVGHRCLGYRLLEPYHSAKWEWRSIRNRGLAQRLERWRQSKRRQLWERLRTGRGEYPLEEVKHLWTNLHKVRIDDVINEPLTNDMSLAVDLIRRGEWRLKVDDYGRVHTNLTNLKKTLRKHLLVDGRRLVNCDIASSQPLFLGMYLAGVAMTPNTPDTTGTTDRGEGQPDATTLCRYISGNLLTF